MKITVFAIATLLLSPLVAVASTKTEFDIENHKGKIVYVDFWASWCTPCRASFPFMQNLSEVHGDSLVVVAINVDKSREDANRFLEQFDINFDVVFDPEGALANSFDLKGMPTSYLYDRNGQLIGSHIGFRKKDISKLEAAIANAINDQE